MINSGVCESKKLNAVSFEAGELWFRLVTRVDDNGNYYRDSLRVYANLMQEKEGCTQASTEKALKELSKIRLITIYRADGREYLHLTDFDKHQTLRGDLAADVGYPLHPPELGKTYLKNGVRRDKCVQERSSTERTVPDTEQDVTDRNVLAFEGEVEDKGEVEGEFASPEFVLTPQNIKTIKTVFREATGVKAVITPKAADDATGICNRYSFDWFLEMMPVWTSEEGGPEKIRASKDKGKWAFSNYVRDVEELLEAKKNGTLDQVVSESEDRTAPANRRPAVQI